MSLSVPSLLGDGEGGLDGARVGAVLRRRILPVLVALLMVGAAVPAPALAQSDTDLSQRDPTIITYDGHPSYVVHYADGELASLHTWANSSSSRRIVRVTEHTAVVAAPVWDLRPLSWKEYGAHAGSLHKALMTDALSERSFIEAVAPNYEHQRTDPISSLEDQSSYDPEDLGVGYRVENPLSSVPATPSGDGLAFSEDAPKTTMAESRSILGVDNVSKRGDNMTIGVIDTGINTANGEVFGNGTDGSDLRIDEDSKNFVANETVYADGIDAVEDGNGHGTWVASAIAANTSNATWDGIAPNASLLVLKALADDGSGSTADIASAVRYAVDNGADVISMSLGSPMYDGELASAVQYAADAGVPVVIAAGNSRQTVKWVASPADVDGAITVAAVSGKVPNASQPAYFSQAGPDPGTTDGSNGATEGEAPDIAAPGMATSARTPTTTGSLQTTTLSGTSMATPMVAGGIALGLEANEDWGLSDVRTWLREGARPIPNASPLEVGAGMFAADHLVNEEVASEDQADAMTEAAASRDDYLRGLSNAEGGFLARIAAVDPRALTV